MKNWFAWQAMKVDLDGNTGRKMSHMFLETPF